MGFEISIWLAAPMNYFQNCDLHQQQKYLFCMSLPCGIQKLAACSRRNGKKHVMTGRNRKVISD
jgi:hypothetical protein